MSRVALVTRVTGFIGSAVAARLAREGVDVFDASSALSRSPGDRASRMGFRLIGGSRATLTISGGVCSIPNRFLHR